MRLPWLPRATIRESSGRLASSASRTAWIPVRRFIDWGISRSIEGGAEFQHASANRLDWRESIDLRGVVEQKHNAVEFASADASRKRHAQRMKDFAAGVRKPGLDRRHNFLQPVGVHGVAVQYFGPQRTKNLACTIPRQDLLAFPRSEHRMSVVFKYQHE